MNWLLAVVIVAVVLIGGCAYVLTSAVETGSNVVKDSIRIQCYELGRLAGAAREDVPVPSDSAECNRWYTEGFQDGRANRYNPPPLD